MLTNKLGIKSESELAREEERISKKRAAELFESGYLITVEYRRAYGNLRLWTSCKTFV